MDNYYYFGEFGYLNLEILGGLEEYFLKNPNKKIKIATSPSYGKLIKYLFPKNVTIKNTKPPSGDGAIRAIHDIKNGSNKYEIKGFINLHDLIKENITGRRGVNIDNLIFIPLLKPIIMSSENKKYISVFPRHRKVCEYKNLSTEYWKTVIRKIRKISDLEIVLHGVKDEMLDLDGDFIVPVDVIDQVKYLNESKLLICPDSGLAHFALNCNCDTMVIGTSHKIFAGFNPFKNKFYITPKEEALKGDLIKRFIEGKELNLREKIRFSFYEHLSALRGFVIYPIKRFIGKRAPSLLKNLQKINSMILSKVYGGK